VWGVALVNGNGKTIGAPFEGPVERLWPFTTTAISTLPSSVSSRHGSEHHHHHSLHMHPSSAVAVAATVPPFIASSCWAYGKDFGLKMWSPRCGAEDAAKDMSSSSSSSSSSSLLPSFDQEARKKYKEIAGAVQKQIADFESTARDIIERSLKLLLVLVDDTSKL
jgi:hypothetical protein